MEIDHIIVGQGLAGTCLAHVLLSRGRRVAVIDRGHVGSSSIVAAGIYNPITGRRYAKTWLADSIFPLIEPFYQSIEKDIGEKVLHPMNILRPLHSVKDQNDLIAKMGQPEISKYVARHLSPENFPFLKGDVGVIETLCSGYLDVKGLITAYRRVLAGNKSLLEEEFDINDLKEKGTGWEYRGLTAENIIFCLGHNPTLGSALDRYATLAVKGEILTVAAEGLPCDYIINQGVFILPLGDDKYRVGATYEHDITDVTPTEAGRKNILERMNKVVFPKVQLIAHEAGIRPAVDDRTPLVGKHPSLNRGYVLNGLGSKGVSLAPYFANRLADLILNDIKMEPAADLSRYWG